MTTFEFDLSKKERDGSAAIFKVNRFMLSLLAKRMKERGMTRKQLADILEVDKSTISKMLRGNQNVTARTMGEICGALDFDFHLVPEDLHRPRSNDRPTYAAKPPLIGTASGAGAATPWATYDSEKSTVQAR